MFPLDLNRLQITILMEHRVLPLESSDGQHISCYEIGVREMPQRQWIASSERIKLIWQQSLCHSYFFVESLMFIMQ